MEGIYLKEFASKIFFAQTRIDHMVNPGMGTYIHVAYMGMWLVWVFDLDS